MWYVLCHAVPRDMPETPAGAQSALHHDVGCLASLTAAEDVWTITLILRPRDTVRCPRGEGLSQPLFMKVTTPPR